MTEQQTVAEKEMKNEMEKEFEKTAQKLTEVWRYGLYTRDVLG